jgi:hypothetical protein
MERSVVMSGAEVLTPDAFILEGDIEATYETDEPAMPNETLRPISIASLSCVSVPRSMRPRATAQLRLRPSVCTALLFTT